MKRQAINPVRRRDFLKQAGLAALATSASQQTSSATESTVAIIVEPDDYVANRPPIKWAITELQKAFKERVLDSRVIGRLPDAAPTDHCILIANQGGAHESVRLSQNTMGGRQVIQAGGTDVRGLVYAVLELADRVRYAPAALDALKLSAPVSDKPANVIRSMSRCFQSDVEDKGWYHDRAMWREYLTMLAYHRFNRFNLCFGLGYNFPRNVTDSYFYFAYPFLLNVPGFKVRAVGLPDSERDQNLETLRFISEETAARGLQFQLGLWTHQYAFENSPNVNYPTEGLTPANHAEYCKQALAALLKACPAISGLTLRVHGESGIPEGSYDFWKTLFESITNCGRKVEIDMHAKGVDQKMIDIASATGMPVNISPKFWAEHMGMPYHQAAIRELEMPPEGDADHGVFALSEGSRKFLRYGYGDLLVEGRKYGIVHRIWPGTQRVLLWGDPKFAAAYGRASSFCGDQGVEWFEPLSFKGRMGSGKLGGRCGYSDESLNPKYDWQKFAYTYRVWGRCIYNPDADPEQWRRWLRSEFGERSLHAEEALATASRILPIVTTVHGASGSNNTYWPEMYTNMPIVDENRKQPYSDTPKPKVYGNASPFDPQIFATVNEVSVDKISQTEVAQWLSHLSNRSRDAMSKVPPTQSAEYRRWQLDIQILSGLGLFFSEKILAAADWNAGATYEAVSHYSKARDAWAEFAAAAKGRYSDDITYGNSSQLRGNWMDRLPDIDGDLEDMKKQPGPPGFAMVQAIITRNQLFYRHVDQSERWQVMTADLPTDHALSLIPPQYKNSKYALQYYLSVRAKLQPGFAPDLTQTPYYVVRPTKTSAGLTPGRRIVLDAHNCYPYEGRWANRIDRALAQGFPVSIEQDLAWHIDPQTGTGRIAIHHGTDTTGREPGLRDYFFERVRPIAEQALRENQRDNWPIIYLHFDFKSVTPPLLEAVWQLLREYQEWITTAPKLADPHVLAPLDVKPIMVLTEEATEQEQVFFNRLPIGGQLRLFGSAIAVRHKRGQPLLPPDQIVSAPPTNYRRWWNSPWDAVELGGQREAGDWTASNDHRLRTLVDYAHNRGYAIRFYTLNGHTPEAGQENGWESSYNFGSVEAVEKRWRAAIHAGVDFIATDQMEGLHAELVSVKGAH